MTAETPAERRERYLAEYDHRHDTTGGFIHDVGGPLLDGVEPVDAESGLRISPATPPHRYPMGHTKYRPHPASIAAQHTERNPS